MTASRSAETHWEQDYHDLQEVRFSYFQPAAVNLASYAGQTIQLVFHGTTDYTLPTTFRIDDVSPIAH